MRGVVAALIFIAGLGCMGGAIPTCPACDTVDPATLTGGFWYEQDLLQAYETGDWGDIDLRQGQAPHVVFTQGTYDDNRRFDAASCTFTGKPNGDDWALAMKCDFNPGLGNYLRWVEDGTVAELRVAGKARTLVHATTPPDAVRQAWLDAHPDDGTAPGEAELEDEEAEEVE